jgi:NAD(P)-dependent dehydrogenase (short-subunit alcohol dehydrogenase family)
VPRLLDSVATSPHAPTLVVSGATASVRGSINWSVIAAGKSAGRIMTQSLAREFGPKGIHVAHVVIDGGIDTPEAENAWGNDATPDGRLAPYAVSYPLRWDGLLF